MATKPKKRTTHKVAPEKRETPVKGAPAPTTLGLYDVRGDDEAVEGHFVDVVSGDHEGKYGVFLYAEGDTAVVKARDDLSDTFTTKITDLRPALAGRR